MSKTKLKPQKMAIFKRTMPYAKKVKGFIFLTLVLCLIISLLNASTPFVTKRIIDTYLKNNQYDMVRYMIILYASLITLLAIFRYLFNIVNNLTGMKIEKMIRDDAIKKINHLPVDYFSLEPDGKIVAKITSDSNGVKMFYTTIFQIINAIMNITIVYISLLIIEPMLGLLMLIILPVIIVWITFYRRRVHKYYIQVRETSSRITGKYNELISASMMIEAYNQEEEMIEDFDELVWLNIKNDRKASTISNIFGFELLSLIKRLTEIFLLLYLGFNSLDVAGVTVTVGLIAVFSENLDKMINPINAIFMNLNELEDSLVAASRVYDYIDEEDDTRIFDGKELDKIDGNVEFKDITFSYVKGHPVLNKLNLNIKAGSRVGIVGHTGSGKSTLMNLLLAFNDYDDGKLLVDGKEINEYNKESYRKELGIVLQNPALFYGTLKSNITMDRDYPDSEVIRVLDLVGASYMLNKTNLGINMPITFKGDNLSLGEKQLICFARIILRNPKIVVLDEASANIDSETEIRIKNAMDIVSKDRTTFIIAHRLSTIKDCDLIVVLDHGKIVGMGNHRSLYDDCLIYKDMYDSQYRNLKKDVIE